MSSIILSIISIIIAVIAIIQTSYQAKLSNKQHLFDRRLKIYMIVNGLLELCKKEYMDLGKKKETKPLFAIEINFSFLTNNTYMENICEIMDHPLENPYKKNFLIKREELRQLASKILFVFGGKEATLFSEFVLAYENMLFKMHQYRIVILHMQDEQEKEPRTYEEWGKYFHEPEWREEVYVARMRLKNAYDEVKNNAVEEKIKKQISLVKRNKGELYK